ncbi:7,8-didemethyl-8-hydroxy-5-deazariboflavin synthase subunit CofG [Gloeothece verrucosa]|uniref:7,8-didemethyl-8-hydroxy-5-deazariboflavin synthase n=1 Tax=Gloeothece verrucosa (strain PCC 7822) TaxID=497965 RepID=E0UBY2_GLOV7|nr:7,8-didemethyl-8-hydroxy-5-deazariboflavin synthase subunit CofG [Gloeothece verrucosa]ADN15197.1 7,8-didemethyl-8-hydroxy-5-deazariboflavin synthase, CofG subunit [Gloeothece verrucosa PCC 7822]
MNNDPNSFVVTYSPAYTLVPTYECFNRCTYCNFRTDIGQSPWLSLTAAREKLQQLQHQGITEILILSGEVHPHSPQRKSWFQRIYDICELALSMGFFPHTNAGPLSQEEMERLKQVNVSMGLMLEQLTPKLLDSVHRHAPSKNPQLRLQQLQWAGELKIPFTTGILLGIGETEQDCRDSLEMIASIHQQWGHIQEVILQPHSPGHQQLFDAPAFKLQQLPKVVEIARQILPSSINIQIPPNLVAHPAILLECIQAGARDLGGIGPVDEVNPDYPHPHPAILKKLLEPAGWQLVPRLPVYPQYYNWLPFSLKI